MGRNIINLKTRNEVIHMDKNIKRSIILDNYQNTINRCRHENDNNYIKMNTRSNTCIDDLDLYLKINNNKIEDLSFDGEACVISTSTTNILSNIIKGKTIDEAIKIIENYNNMIDEKEYNKELIGEACVYDDIGKQPARITCATLSWNSIYKELLKYKENK